MNRECKIVKDKNGNIIYQEYPDGSYERNMYNENNKLIKNEFHYANGIVETQQYNEK